MQGVDTVLFSLCHGNNTKPNCPPFCLSTCIYFVFLFSFLSLACTVSFLGVRLSPSLHHSPLLEPILLCGQALSIPTQRRTERNLDLLSVPVASHLHYSSDPTQEIVIPRFALSLPPLTLPCVVTHSSP